MRPLPYNCRPAAPMINQLWSNILWGQRSNFVGVPTDCPQRDERLGWTADAQVFWRTASYNMDLTQFSKKFARRSRGTQVGTPMYGIFAPGTDTPSPGFGAGLERCRGHHSLDGMATIRRHPRHRAELGRDGEVSAAIQAANPTYSGRQATGHPLAIGCLPKVRHLSPWLQLLIGPTTSR